MQMAGRPVYATAVGTRPTETGKVAAGMVYRRIGAGNGVGSWEGMGSRVGGVDLLSPFS